MLQRVSGRTLQGLAAGFSSQARFASTLVVADHNNSGLASGTLSAITAAKAIGDEVHVLVAGKDAGAAAEAASKVAGVSKVLHADADCLANAVAENVTNVVLQSQEANSYTHILAPASNAGKNFLPRVAAKLDVAQISDVTKVLGEDTFERPMYAGNAMATVKTSDGVKVLTVRATAFERAEAEGGSAAVEALDAAGTDAGKSTFVSEEIVKSDRPALDDADVVISGGRGMKNGENFEMLYKLADKLGGAVGASRAAVDAGYVPNDMQIGQTGKVVAPGLYMAVGISGAIQHVAGMKDAKTIVCINKDPEAPMFQISDFGLVEDLFKAVPELTEKV